MRRALERVGSLSWRVWGGIDGRETEPSRVGEGLVAADPAARGDVILAGRETPTSYHLAVVVDDALQGVTDVVRGLDLFAATSVHRLLQELLGLPPPAYRHHRLILDETERKLAKSSGDTGLAELRASGATPGDVRRRERSDRAGRAGSSRVRGRGRKGGHPPTRTGGAAAGIGLGRWGFRQATIFNVG